MAQYSYEIGTSIGSRVNVEGIISRPPYGSTYQAYSQQLELGNAQVRGAGYPVTIWHWDSLPLVDRDVLRTYCTGASALVSIKTRKLDSTDAFTTYQAVMVWPQAEERLTNGLRQSFDLMFRLVAVTT